MGAFSTARPTVTHECKAFLSVFLLVGVFTDIGVHAAAINTAVKAERDLYSTSSIEMNNDNGLQMDNIRNKRLIPRPSEDVPAPIKDSCYSAVLNDTLPAAHIKGRGEVWGETDDDSYVPKWDCESKTLHTPAFVSGGMWFQQDDVSLYVPTCGWYYVSSKISFQSSDPRPQNFTHTLRIERNCNSSSNIYSHTASTVIGPLEMDSYARASTFVGDLVKICTGGRIYVHIPLNKNACCPLGDESQTLLTAHLVRDSDCEWPVSSFNEPQEPFQERPQRE